MILAYLSNWFAFLIKVALLVFIPLALWQYFLHYKPFIEIQHVQGPLPVFKTHNQSLEAMQLWWVVQHTRFQKKCGWMSFCMWMAPWLSCGCYPIPEHNQCSSYGTECGALVAASTHPPKYVLVYVFLCNWWLQLLGIKTRVLIAVPTICPNTFFSLCICEFHGYSYWYL